MFEQNLSRFDVLPAACDCSDSLVEVVALEHGDPAVHDPRDQKELSIQATPGSDTPPLLRYTTQPQRTHHRATGEQRNLQIDPAETEPQVRHERSTGQTPQMTERSWSRVGEPAGPLGV